jgi:hypothetical protein
MSTTTRIHLQRGLFGEKEKTVLEHGSLTVSAFTYSTGVEALRLKNGRGEIVLLPYQGQQVWSASFDGRELTMRSMFAEPVPTRDYLATYGAFLVHCGITAMGVPGPEDHHPLHGELPNAPYAGAYLEAGSDAGGGWVGVGGRYQHTLAFNRNYAAEPLVKLHEGASLIEILMRVTNLMHVDMELMYMMHVNFRPVDRGRLVYSARPNPTEVKTHVSIPSHMQSSGSGSRLMEFLKRLEANPSLHHVLAPDLCFDPEIVFTIRYRADSEGWAHSMQVHPDGWASYIRHRPQELDYGIRWIARNADQDALGLVLPATAEHKGHAAAKAKGQLRSVRGGDTVEFHAEAGLLRAEEAKAMETRIGRILAL